MRLINTSTLRLQSFPDNSAPPYAILSHTWGSESEEVTYQSVKDRTANELGLGWHKLEGCCKLAKQVNIPYAWIDTCCIDKTNSVELGEAVNSMFRWYRHASICYVYLSDVPTCDDSPQHCSRFQTSRWFRRGWTLQELLAPKHVQFYNSEWEFLGTKSGLYAPVSSITGIPREFLLGTTDLRSASVAQRMSWAADRQTKREEDAAYSLLGIFDISMPMIYGEGGEHAFLRLQEQILRNTRDDSILAWGLNSKASQLSNKSNDLGLARPGRILATAPSEFANSGHVVTKESLSSLEETINFTGGGIRISLSILERSTEERIGLLRCGLEHNSETVVGIPLIRLNSNEFARPDAWESMLVATESSSNARQVIFITNNPQDEALDEAESHYWLYDKDKFAKFNLDLIEVFPESCWDRESSLLKVVCKPDEIANHRIWARFRDSVHTCRDFIILLWLEKPDLSSPILDRCRVLVCSRTTILELSASFLHDMPPTAFKSNCASNGVRILRVKTVPRMQETVSIEPETVSVEPETTSIEPETVNIEPPPESMTYPLVTFHETTDFNELYLRKWSANRILDSERIRATQNALNESIAEKSDKCQMLSEERLELEDEIRRLQHKTRVLAEAERNEYQALQMMRHRQTGLHLQQYQIYGSWTHAQLCRRQLLCFHSGQSSCDLDKMPDEKQLIWAEREGFLPLLEKLIQNDHHHHIPSGEISTREQHLSCAVATGHQDVVRLLLAAGNVRVDSRNGRDKTPLQSAASLGYEAIVKLLLGVGNILHGVDPRAENHLKLVKNDYMFCVGFPQDSKLVVCCPNLLDHTISLGSMRQESRVNIHMYRDHRVQMVVFSHDSKLLASASTDGRIGIWDIATGKCKHMLVNGVCPAAVAFSLDSQLVAATALDGLRIWKTATGQCKKKLPTTSHHVAFSSDAKLLASGPPDGVEIWNISTKQLLRTFSLAHGSRIQSVTFSRDSKLIACITYPQDFVVLSLVTGEYMNIRQGITPGECLQMLLSMHQPLRSVAFSCDLKSIIGISGLAICKDLECDDLHCHNSRLWKIRRKLSTDASNIRQGG